MPFVPATKQQSYLRLALTGPAGYGKTYSALNVASLLFPGRYPRIAVIDTEHGTASKYAHLFKFDKLDLDDFAVEGCIEAIIEAEAASYDVVIIDSLSHFWMGPGGILEYHDRVTEASPSKDSWSAWKKATPKQRSLIEALLRVPLHVIATMRSEVETQRVEAEKPGEKAKIVSIGLQPVQRKDVTYEFDLVLDLDDEHIATVRKTRCEFMDIGSRWPKPGREIAEILYGWLTTGQPLTDNLSTEFREKMRAIGKERMIAALVPQYYRTSDEVKAAFKTAFDGPYENARHNTYVETLRQLAVDRAAAEAERLANPIPQS